MITGEQKEKLLKEVYKLHERNALSKTIGPDYYEPGMMEYLDQSDGLYDEENGKIILRFEAKGTRYDGRTECIETVKLGERIHVVRDKENQFNPNNFRLLTLKEKDVGNVPAELCNAIAPIYDNGDFTIEEASVSFVEPISKRSRYAKQAMLFIEMKCRFC